MSLFRYNRILLYPLKTRLIIPSQPTSVIVRHATEIRSRKPVQKDANTKQRKNTVNPVAQIKKLGDKAGMMDFKKFVHMNLNGIHLYMFSQDTFK